jgi:FtsH-binding integral membrane protein
MASAKQLIQKPSTQGDKKYIEFLRLRIYGTITLMAANAGLLLQGDARLRQSFIVILTTTFGLWLAGLVSVFIAHRIVHEKPASKTTVLHELNVHRGVLLAGLPSVIMLLLALMNVVELQTALITNIAVAVTSLTIATVRAAKSTSENTFMVAILSITAQTIVGLLIVAAKFSAK